MIVAALLLATALGPRVDPSDFRFSRDIPGTEPGIVSLRIDLHVAAHSDESVSDVRIVDETNRQVQFIVERRNERIDVPLTMTSESEGQKHVYHLALPYASMPAGSRVTLTTEPGTFEREIEVRIPADASHERRDRTLDHLRWRSTPAEKATPALAFEVGPGYERVDVIIDEGDNAPLPLRPPRLDVPVYRLRFDRPKGHLRLLYGSNTVRPPNYDLALRTAELLAAPAKEVTIDASPVLENAQTKPRLDRRIFWGALIATVLVLLLLLARLIRAERGANGEPRSDHPAPPAP